MCGIPNSITIVNTTPAIYKNLKVAAKFFPWWDGFLSLSLFLSSCPFFVASWHHLYLGLCAQRATISASLGCKEQKIVHIHIHKCFLCSTLDKPPSLDSNNVANKDKGMEVYVQCILQCNFMSIYQWDEATLWRNIWSLVANSSTWAHCISSVPFLSFLSRRLLEWQ